MTVHEAELADLAKKLKDAEMIRDIRNKTITIISSSDRKSASDGLLQTRCLNHEIHLNLTSNVSN